MTRQADHNQSVLAALR